MTPKIARAAARLKKAEDHMKTVLKSEQAKCKHKAIVQMAWKSGEWFGPHAGRRICTVCGLEQQGRSYGDEDYHYTRLKSNGFHKKVCDEEFYKFRLPEAEADAK